MRTSLYSILCIVIRLGAVLLGLSVFATGLTLIVTWRETAEVWGLWPAAVMVPLVMLVAFLLWLFPGALARLACGRSAEQVFESPVSAAQMQWVALSVLGMYFVVSGLAGLGNFMVRHLAIRTIIDQDRALNDMIATGLYWIVQIGLGVALTLGSRGLAGVLQRLRYGGAEPWSESGSADDAADVTKSRDG